MPVRGYQGRLHKRYAAEIVANRLRQRVRDQGTVGPQLVATYFVSSGGSNTNTLVTPSFTPADGEVIVVKAASQHGDGGAFPTPTGGSLTYTNRATIGNVASHDRADIWTAVVGTSPGSMAVSVGSPGATANEHVIQVNRWSNAQLDATPAAIRTGYSVAGAPSTTLTTEADNSVLDWLNTDWNAIDGVNRAYLTTSGAPAELAYQFSGGGTHYFAFQPAMVAGSQTFGLSAPGGQAWDLLGVEVQLLVAGGANFTQTVTDNVGIQDSELQEAAYAQTEPDTVGVLDTEVQQLTAIQSFTDQINITDSTTAGLVFAFTFSDNIGILDTQVQVSTFLQMQTDPEGITDSQTQVSVFTQTVTNAVGLLDAVVQAATYLQSFTDNLPITDTSAGNFVIAQTITDNVGILDTETQQATYQQTITDSGGITDSRTQTSAFAQTFTDAEGILDALIQVATLLRSQIDSLPIADSITQDQFVLIAQTITDVIGIADSAARVLDANPQITDALGIVDAASRLLNAVQTLTDAVGTTDMQTQVTNILRTITDTVPITDVLVVGFGQGAPIYVTAVYPSYEFVSRYPGHNYVAAVSEEEYLAWVGLSLVGG